jgi:hypothetical protein
MDGSSGPEIFEQAEKFDPEVEDSGVGVYGRGLFAEI